MSFPHLRVRVSSVPRVKRFVLKTVVNNSNPNELCININQFNLTLKLYSKSKQVL